MQQKIEICSGTLGIKTSETLKELITVGYKTFDLATAYSGGHELLGEALHGIARNEIKICSKINDNDLLNHNFSIRSILDNILKELNTGYVDILMFHSPALLLHEHATKVLEELIALKREGKIKEIGVSNFTVSDLERMGEYRRLIKYNQIEMSPYLTQDETVKYCQQNSIQIMAYGSFGRGKADIAGEEVIKGIATKHGVTPHQVILAWLLEQNIIPVVKASSSSHMESNLKATSIELESEDINAISSLNRNFQTCFWKKFVKLQNIEQYNDVPLVKPISAHVSLSVLTNNSTRKEELVAEYLDFQAKL